MESEGGDDCGETANVHILITGDVLWWWILHFGFGIELAAGVG